ncbi:hypothetical protein FRB95_009432 [Tulasnella sp. JGI-2019a]|nr:hypothetical protein FRB95_009432 [Tulasnella sp. JGI-2019a]
MNGRMEQMNGMVVGDQPGNAGRDSTNHLPASTIASERRGTDIAPSNAIAPVELVHFTHMASINEPPPPKYHRRESDPDLKRSISQVQHMSMEDEKRHLPEGWVRQFDTKSSHYFYVDTRANPSRSIWVHPFEDLQWQKETAASVGPPPGPPPNASSDSRLGNDNLDENGTEGQGEDRTRGFFYFRHGRVEGRQGWPQPDERKAQQEREMQARYLERRQLLLGDQANRQVRHPHSSNYKSRIQPVHTAPQAMYGHQKISNDGGVMGMPLSGGLTGGFALGDTSGGGFEEGVGGFGDGGGEFAGGGGGFANKF